jgi:hypothetical protein
LRPLGETSHIVQTLNLYALFGGEAL